MVKEPDLVSWSPLKLATPLVAGSDVVPPAKLPEESATEMVSFEPVPAVTTLLYWSSRVAPRLTVPPAVSGAAPAGC